MFDAAYRKRLARDLPVWRDRGWVTEDGMSAIPASLDARRAPGFGLAAVIAVLGAVLIGLGIVAFVGANWDYMPRIFRFGLLIVCLAAAYGFGAYLQRRNLPRFADAAVLLGGLVFAAAIALVGQTYHMAGAFADAVLLWLVGAYIAAFATRSVSGTVLALAGAAYWIWITTVENGAAPHWGGLVAVFSGGALAVWLDSRIARVAAILALGFWLVVTTVWAGTRLDWPAAGSLATLACIGLAVWTAGIVMTMQSEEKAPRAVRLGHDLLMPSFGGFLLAAGVLQIALFDTADAAGNRTWIWIAAGMLAVAVVLASVAWQRGGLRVIDIVAVAALGAGVIAVAVWTNTDEFMLRLAAGMLVILGALWWISLGHAGHSADGRLGLFAFGVEVLYLYSVTLGSLIDTALAFVVGGVLFIALAVFLFRLDRKFAAKSGGGA